MATITNTIADSSGFVPQTWALEALNVLRNQIQLAKLVTTDADMGEAGWVGKTLNIPYPGTFSAQDKVAGTAITAQAPSGGATVSLTLSKHKVVDFTVEDYAAAQSNANLMQRYVQPAVIALAEQLENDLWTQAQAFTGGVVGTVGTSINAATLFAAAKQLTTNKAPLTDRYAVISPNDKFSMLQDSTLATYFAFAQSQSLTTGTLGMFGGMDTRESNLVPVNPQYGVQTVTITGSPTGGTFTLTFGGQTTSGIAYNASASAVQTALAALSTVGTGNVNVSGSAGGPYRVEFDSSVTYGALTASGASLTGGSSPGVTIAQVSTANYNIAFHKSAIMLAMRAFPPISAGEGVATSTVVDDESGLAIRVLKQYNPSYRAEYVGFDILYGMVALRPTMGVLMLS